MIKRILVFLSMGGLLQGWLAAPSAVMAAAPATSASAAGWPANQSEAGWLGLYPASDFRLVDGRCTDCQTMRQALWYFQDDMVAVPGKGVRMAGFSPGVRAQEDVRQWHAQTRKDDPQSRPALIWLGATRLVGDTTLNAAGDALRLPDGRDIPFRVVPKISTNLSYYDDSSIAFFRDRPLRIRGEMKTGPDGRAVWEARTIWPQDWAIDAQRLSLQPLGANETLAGLVRAHANGRDERYEARLLWERSPGASRDWSRHAVTAFMLNGAQGDDDEAHGGHFAIATGHYGAGGWSDWMVNNFYNLDSYSEKGIVASMLPMDNYMADLNSGQSYYRPSYMLVAVLKSGRAAHAYQGAIARVFNHLYRHDFHYRHAGANCAGISMDTLRSLGWDIPATGATSLLKAVAAYPYKAITDQSFASGQQAFDYLSEEQSRLYPAAAFNAAGNDLLRIAASGQRIGAGALENMLHEDLQALVFVRIPQIPSSRAFGSFPVSTIDEYMQRVPEDKAQWKIVPVGARPFPAELRDTDTLSDEPLPPWTPALASLLVVAGVFAGRRAVKSRKS